MSNPVAGAASVMLYWSDVYRASSYNLYWSTTPGVSKTNGNKVAGVGSPYNHTNLTNGTTYYYVVTAVDGSGTESAESSQVSARPAGWSDGTQFMRSDIYSIYPQSVQINDTGTAVAAWLRVHPLWWDASALHVNIYQGGTWHTATVLGSYAYSPSVALTASGDAIVVYCQPFYDAMGGLHRTLINSRRYDHLTGTWSAAKINQRQRVVLCRRSRYRRRFQWQCHRHLDEDSQTWARRFDATLGAWETSATNLSVTNVPHRIVVDGSNIFTAVWVETRLCSLAASMRHSIYGMPAFASAMILPSCPAHRICRSTSIQQGVSSWSGSKEPRFPTIQPNTPSTVRASTRSQIHGVAPAALTASASLAHSPHVAVDNAGNAMAAWLQTETTGSSLQTARFVATGSTWSAPMLTDQTGTGMIASIVLGMDGNGNAEVIWSDTTGIVERRYDAATSTWGGFNTNLGQAQRAHRRHE